MTARTDVIVNWSVSPRIITVLSPSTSISIQDLVDTCRVNESLIENLTYDRLVDAAGKDNLGGGILVGITATLHNAVLAFESRIGPNYIQCNVSGGNLVAVDLTNSNIAPIYPTAFTQIITTSSSSATLQQSDDIQYSSFSNGVSVNENSAYSGTVYPIGTPRQPVNNFFDALSIANQRGFNHIYLSSGPITLTAGLDYSNLIFEGQGTNFEGQGTNITNLTILSGITINNSIFKTMSIDGVLDGQSHIEDCLIGDLSYVSGYIHKDCILSGILILNGDANIDSVVASIADPSPTIDFNNQPVSLAIRKYSGELLIKNKTTSTGTISINLDSSIVTIDSSCTNGTFVIRGVGQVIDNSTGTAVIDTAGLVNQEVIRNKIWNTNINDYAGETNTMGKEIAKKKDVFNAQIIFK